MLKKKNQLVIYFQKFGQKKKNKHNIQIWTFKSI